jgi:hypothetical protein
MTWAMCEEQLGQICGQLSTRCRRSVAWIGSPKAACEGWPIVTRCPCGCSGLVALPLIPKAKSRETMESRSTSHADQRSRRFWFDQAPKGLVIRIQASGGRRISVQILNGRQRPALVKICFRGCLEPEEAEAVLPGTVGIQFFSRPFGAFGPT